MIKAITLFAALFTFLCSLDVDAKILRIGYPGIAVPGIDYEASQFSNAITAAAAGDTIQLYQQYWQQGATHYTISKKLTFIGFGYMLHQNPTLQAINARDQHAATLGFISGSEGSVVQGVFGTVFMAADNISINRSRIYVHLGYHATTGATINTSGIVLNNNYLYVQDYVASTNLNVSNNIFYAGFQLDNSTGLFSNNIVNSSYTLYSFLVKNNIFIGGGCPTLNSNVIENNLFGGNCSSSISGTGNKFSVNMQDVFQFWNATYGEGALFYTYGETVQDYTDNRFALKEGGAAKGAGKSNNGATTDAGIFGGDAGDIYRLSGIPAVPSIYKLTAPTTTATSNPYTITVSVKSNN